MPTVLGLHNSNLNENVRGKDVPTVLGLHNSKSNENMRLKKDVPTVLGLHNNAAEHKRTKETTGTS